MNQIKHKIVLPSDDGGLNFNPFNSNPLGQDLSGSAYSLEARVDLADITSLSGSIGAWFKEPDADFSTANLDIGNKTTDTAVEAIVEVNDKVDISVRATQLERRIKQRDHRERISRCKSQ